VIIPRRLFLRSAGAIACVLPHLYLGLRGNAQTGSPLERIAGLFNQPHSALWLGSRATAVLSVPDDPILALAQLDNGAFISRVQGIESDQALRHYIRQLERQDFAAGRTVELEGWILSETEVRICAALARGC
jgi:hypothetical protein